MIQFRPVKGISILQMCLRYFIPIQCSFNLDVLLTVTDTAYMNQSFTDCACTVVIINIKFNWYNMHDDMKLVLRICMSYRELKR